MISYQPAITLITAALVLAMAGCAANKTIVLNDVERFSGTISAIDRAEKTMTIQRTEGEPVSVKMYNLADNYEEELVGMNVDVQFHRSFSLTPYHSCREGHIDETLQKPRSVRLATPQSDGIASTGKTAYVERISPEENLLLLRQPDGSVISLELNENVREFNNVQQGDRMVVHHSDSLVILVRDNTTPSPR